jgi:glutamate dehydrogenase (NAD(P)+)
MMARSKTDRISHRMAAMAIGVEKGRNAMNMRGLFP